MRDPDQGAGTRYWWCVIATSLMCLVLWPTLSALAQDGSVPAWGQRTTTEARTRLDDDPSAGAVVVLDQGLITVGPGFKFTYDRRKRVQIFGQSAYRYANIEITVHKSEKIEQIEAHTITPMGQKIDVRADQIMKSETSDLLTYAIAFPEVSPGCVVEYRYHLSSNNFYYLRPWAFQNDAIPTEYSEIAVRLPEGFEYEAVLNNADLVQGPDTNYVATLRQDGKVREFTWRGRHLPPLVGEPFVLSLLDHRAQLDFQIVRFREGNKVWEFVDSWQDVAKQVRNVYKSLLRTDSNWPTFGKADNAKTSQLDLANRLYTFVRDSVARVGNSYTIASGLKPARQVLDQRRGNELEKNLLLVALLRHHGFDAYPLLISRRDHLRFDRRDHRLYQFDHALVLIEIGNEKIFCDANSPGAWLGYLPPTDQVDAGVVIGHPSSDQVVLDVPAPPVGNDAAANATVELRDDGSAVGHLEGDVSGEAAYRLLRAMADRDTAGYLQDNWLPGAIPVDFTAAVDQVNGWAPVHFSADFVWPEAATVDQGRLFLRPSILRKLKENPLLTSTRRYPISFETPWSEDCRIVWKLPKDFTLTEVPTSREMTGDGYEFHSSVVRDQNEVISSRTWRVTKRDFPVSRFEDLRELFNTVQLSERGLMVLYHDSL